MPRTQAVSADASATAARNLATLKHFAALVEKVSRISVSPAQQQQQEMSEAMVGFYASEVRCGETGFEDRAPVPAADCLGEFFAHWNGSVLSNIAFVNFAVDTDSGGTVFLLRLTTDISAAAPDGKALPGTATSGFTNIVMVAFDEQGKIATYRYFPDTQMPTTS